MNKPLNASQIAERLRFLDGWNVDGDKIFKKFTFKDFLEAMSFMNKVAYHAEQMNHHPDWKNEYKVVEVYLTTHSVGKVTDLDTTLANTMNKMAGECTS